MKKQNSPAPEWSFVLMAEDVSETPRRYTFAADAEACAALKDRFEVLDLSNVRADITVCRVRGGDIIRVAGTVSAHVTQACVVTLAPVEADITDTIEAYFTQNTVVVPFSRLGGSSGSGRDAAGDDEDGGGFGTGASGLEILDEENAPEVIVDGEINLGEVAAQFLSLALPAYPRAKDAPSTFMVEEDGAADSSSVGSSGEDTKSNPFAALKEWKEGL